MRKFIIGRFRLNFKDYTTDKYDEVVLPKFPEIDRFCGEIGLHYAEMCDTEDNEVFFNYKVVRNTIKECRATRTVIKTKLKEVCGVTVEEVLCAEGDHL